MTTEAKSYLVSNDGPNENTVKAAFQEVIKISKTVITSRVSQHSCNQESSGVPKTEIYAH